MLFGQVATSSTPFRPKMFPQSSFVAVFQVACQRDLYGLQRFPLGYNSRTCGASGRSSRGHECDGHL